MFLPVDPVIIRPNGNITLFGLNNHFNPAMPNKLLSIIAPDEYSYTIRKTNKILKRRMSFNFKIFLCSCLCCCCTCGLSLCPSIVVNNHTKEMIQDCLDTENERIYHKLGLHWSFSKHRYGSIPLVEYVIFINFLEKEKIYRPD